MNKYIHDYTLAAHAQRYLNRAITALRCDEPDSALLYLIQARSELGQYLKTDNMIKENDAFGAWYYAPEIDDGIKYTPDKPRLTCNSCRYYIDEGCEYPDQPPCDDPYYF